MKFQFPYLTWILRSLCLLAIVYFALFFLDSDGRGEKYFLLFIPVAFVTEFAKIVFRSRRVTGLFFPRDIQDFYKSDRAIRYMPVKDQQRLYQAFTKAKP